MRISYNWLKEYVELPEPKKLADLLTMHAFEVESVDNNVFQIDVLPNRAHDCLSHIGIARECAAILGKKLKLPVVKIKETNEDIKVENKEAEACPRYTARVIKNVKVGPSPKWLQDRLKVLDQKSINNIVDLANYVMLETGQPLHAFDLDKIDKLVIRKAKKGEKMITLDGEKCDLDNDILVIADSKDPLALAGVKGGKKAEITSKTKNIVLESANFNYHTVRTTCKKTGIKTEASMRFENDLDPNLASQAINRLASLIQGDIGKLVDIYPKKVFSVKMKLNLKKVEKVLGIKVSKQDAIKYLKSLEFDVDNSLKVVVPTFRRDIHIEEDLIEEIARLIGYSKIPVEAPLGLLGTTKLDEVLSITNKVKTILDGFGFTEVYNFSFVEEGGKDYLELKNPLSVDLKYLRKDLLTNLLKNLKDNIKSFDEIRIFELGKTYRKEKTEEKMLAGLIAVQQERTRGEKFYELKGIIDSLFNKLGIADHWYDDFQATPEWTDDKFWQKGNTAEVKLGNEEVGFIGEINHKALSKIKGTVVGFNINFEKLLKLAQDELIYQPSSAYPAAIRDLAILVNRGDKVADVLNVINSAGGNLVRDVDLFDTYEGGFKEKKSLAFHIIFQSDVKTLRDEEVDKIQRKIIKELEKKGWQVRK